MRSATRLALLSWQYIARFTLRCSLYQLLPRRRQFGLAMGDGLAFRLESCKALLSVFLPGGYPAAVDVFTNPGCARSVIGRFLSRAGVPFALT